MDLEVSDEDVEELVDEHSGETTTAELQVLHLEVQQTTDEEEEKGKNVPYSETKHIFFIWNIRWGEGLIFKSHDLRTSLFV